MSEIEIILSIIIKNFIINYKNNTQKYKEIRDKMKDRIQNKNKKLNYVECINISKKNLKNIALIIKMDNIDITKYGNLLIEIENIKQLLNSNDDTSNFMDSMLQIQETAEDLYFIKNEELLENEFKIINKELNKYLETLELIK